MNQTTETVESYLESIEHQGKKEDTRTLFELFKEVSGKPPVIYQGGIVGFGSYHYVYASGHSGDAPLIGFKTQKAKFSIYLATGDAERDRLLSELGKHKMGKACLYVNKLADIDLDVLSALLKQSIDFLKKNYPETKE